MNWAETDEALSVIYRRWHELDEVEPTEGRPNPKKGKPASPEHLAWNKLKDDEVRKPSVALHNERIRLNLQASKYAPKAWVSLSK